MSNKYKKNAPFFPTHLLGASPYAILFPRFYYLVMPWLRQKPGITPYHLKFRVAGLVSLAGGSMRTHINTQIWNWQAQMQLKIGIDARPWLRAYTRGYRRIRVCEQLKGDFQNISLRNGKKQQTEASAISSKSTGENPNERTNERRDKQYYLDAISCEKK